MPQRRLRALIVSYAFPPWGEVGAIRIWQLCRRLPEHGIDPVVLTVKEECLDIRDASITLPPDLRILRTHVIANPLDWYRKLRSDSAGASHGPGSPPNGSEVKRSGLRKNILAAFHLPDRYWGWYLPALRAASELLRRERVDVIFSSGPPWIPHVICRKIKRKYGIPWVADFRDPWAKLSHGNVLRPEWWNHLAERMEERCVRDTDLVVCNTQRLRDAMRQAFPAFDSAKFVTLSNGYDDSVLVQPPTKVSSPQKLLLHLGSLYGGRKIDTFVQAFAKLIESGRIPAGSAKILFQGDSDPRFITETNAQFPDLVANESVEFRARVRFEEARELLWKSDLLLLFQGSHSLQMPAKFYEYLQTGIPILAVCDEGALSDVIDATSSGVWVPAADPDQICQKLIQALQMPRRSLEEIGRSSAAYRYSSLAQTLAKWMEELASKNDARS